MGDELRENPKKKGGGSGSVSVRIENGPKRKPRKKGGRKNPKRGKAPRRRRRRNPEESFGSRVGSLAMMAGVGLLTGVVTVVAQAKIAPGNKLALYGIPAAVALGGAWLAGDHPAIGTGVALGAASPFVLPLASRALTPASTTGTPSTVAANAAANAAVAGIDAVEMGDEFYHALNAVTLDAVELGGQHRHMQAVEMGDDDGEWDDDDDAMYDDASYG